MAKVVLPIEVARTFAGGVREHEVDAADIRQVVRRLDETFPGIGDTLRTGLAVAIDGEIFQDWFVQPVAPGSEVFFLPAIEGG